MISIEKRRFNALKKFIVKSEFYGNNKRGNIQVHTYFDVKYTLILANK